MNSLIFNTGNVLLVYNQTRLQLCMSTSRLWDIHDSHEGGRECTFLLLFETIGFVGHSLFCIEKKYKTGHSSSCVPPCSGSNIYL